MAVDGRPRNPTAMMTTPTEARLSPGERRVLHELLEGQTNIAIGRRLGLSDKTVKNHLAHILRKAHCESRLELAIKVFKERERMLRRKHAA